MTRGYSPVKDPAYYCFACDQWFPVRILKSDHDRDVHGVGEPEPEPR